MKNKQKGSAVSLLLIVVGILIIGGGIYFYLPVYNEMIVNKYRTESYREYEKQNVTEDKIKNATSTNTKVIVNTNVKNYKNIENGFEFLYPSTATLKQNYDTEREFGLSVSNLKFPDIKISQLLEIRIDKTSTNSCDFLGEKTTTAQFNGIDFVLNQINSGGMESRGYITSYSTKHNGWCYMVSLHAGWSKYDESTYNPNTGSQINNIELDLEDQKVRGAQIMSTFKFIN